MCKEKERLRKKAAIIAKKLLPDDGLAAQKLLQNQHFIAANCVFCYVCVGTEPRTDIIINAALAAGKTVCVPCTKANGYMLACKIDSLTQLAPARFGLLEPSENAPVIPPSQIDLAIVPCVAASKNGARLGHGAGYYDRFLPKTNAYKIVLCREELVMSNIVQTQQDIICDELIAT